MLYISLVSRKVWLWTTLPGRAAIWLASAELAMQKIPEICAARYLFPGEPWHDRVQPLGGDREGQLRWLFRHARSTLVQRLLGGYYYPCHLTHTHKFVGICMLPFNVLKCVGSGTSINPVWIKQDVFRIKHHRLRIKTILLVVVFRVQSPPRPPGPTMWFWFSWVFWSIVFFEAPASPNLMAKTQFWHRTKLFDLQQNILKWFLKFFPIRLPFSDVWGDCWLREGQNLHINISQKVWAPDDGVVPADLSHWQEAWKAKWHCWWFLFLLKLRTSFLSQSRINWRAGRGKAKMSSLYWYPGLSALETLNLLVLCWPMIVTICVSGQPLRPTSTSGWRSIPTTYHNTTGSSSTVTKPKQRRKGTASHIVQL